MTEEQRKRRRDYMREYLRKPENRAKHLFRDKARKHRATPEQIARRRAEGHAYYEKNKDKWEAQRQRPDVKERRKLAERGKSKQVRQLLDEMKLASGCIDCGYREHACALDFDHVRGTKLRCVTRHSTFAGALAEAAKCVVRCANCHRVVTQQRRQSLSAEKDSR